MTSIFVPFIIALIFSLFLVPAVRFISLRGGYLSLPRDDRWHTTPTPNFGGVAIFIAFISSLLVIQILDSLGITGQIEINVRWNLLLGSVIIFFLGLIDDFRELSPPVKLIFQILATAVIVYEGYSTQFFTPRLENELVAQILNIILTFVWVVGITNAMNLLDNMDGLAGGIALISALILSLIFFNVKDFSMMIMTLSLAGSVVGFLVFNLPPAKIFMGDSGSLFLGFTLAVLAIARQPQASNVVAILGVPTLLFLIPIFDTILVTLTRLLKGQSPVRGGRDHTSHRLISFGLSPKRVLVIFYTVAIFVGLTAAMLESIRYWYSLVIVPILVIVIALGVSYLGGVKIVGVEETEINPRLNRWIGILSFRRRIFEIILDFFIISIALYLAFLSTNNLNMDSVIMLVYLRIFPLALAGGFIAFFIFGVYRGVWRYITIVNIINFIFAALGGGFFFAILVRHFDRSVELPVSLYGSFIIFLFLGLAGSRSSYKVFRYIFQRQDKINFEKILIIGASDQGELALRWIEINNDLNFQPIGFWDNSPLMGGRYIHGKPVYTGLKHFDRLLRRKQISGVIIAQDPNNKENLYQQLVPICQHNGCWIKFFNLSLCDQP